MMQILCCGWWLRERRAWWWQGGVAVAAFVGVTAGQGCRGAVRGKACGCSQASTSSAARCSVELSRDWQVCELPSQERQSSCGGAVPWHACWSGPAVMVVRHGFGQRLQQYGGQKPGISVQLHAHIVPASENWLGLGQVCTMPGWCFSCQCRQFVLYNVCTYMWVYVAYARVVLWYASDDVHAMQ